MCLTMTMAGHWTMVNGDDDDAIEDDNTGDDLIIMTLVVTIYCHRENLRTLGSTRDLSLLERVANRPPLARPAEVQQSALFRNSSFI